MDAGAMRSRRPMSRYRRQRLRRVAFVDLSSDDVRMARVHEFGRFLLSTGEGVFGKGNQR